MVALQPRDAAGQRVVQPSVAPFVADELIPALRRIELQPDAEQPDWPVEFEEVEQVQRCRGERLPIDARRRQLADLGPGVERVGAHGHRYPGDDATLGHYLGERLPRQFDYSRFDF